MEIALRNEKNILSPPFSRWLDKNVKIDFVLWKEKYFLYI